MTDEIRLPEKKHDPSFEAAIMPDPELLKAGWVKRFLADPARADEAIELYSKAGFEVRVEKLRPKDFDERCGECPALVCKSYVMVYTRKKKEK